jgi:hypothetical protein
MSWEAAAQFAGGLDSGEFPPKPTSPAISTTGSAPRAIATVGGRHAGGLGAKGLRGGCCITICTTLALNYGA